MKIKIIIDKNAQEEVTVVAHCRTQLVKQIEQLVENSTKIFVGYKDGEAKKFSLVDVQCFFIEGGKVYANLSKEKLQLKSRLYEIESVVNDSFVRINQSCIANLQHVKKFSAVFNGTIMMTLKNGYSDYVARRELKNVKEKIKEIKL